MQKRALLPIASAAFLAACAATPGGSPALSTPPSGSASPTESAGPSLSPTAASASARPSASPAAGSGFQVWQNQALATVRVNGLNVRIAPGQSQPLVQDMTGRFEPDGVVRLNAGEHVLVTGVADGGDGLQWVQIAAQRDARQQPVAVGWAVAGTVDDPWVEEDNSWCPGAEPSFEALVGLTGIERVGCYSSIPLTFTAQQATIAPDAGLGGACLGEPVPWLQCDHVNYNWVNRDGGYDWEFLLHFDPATGIGPTGLASSGESARYTITGHFDDPAATACGPNPPTTNDDLASYLTCSTLFVVESIH